MKLSPTQTAITDKMQKENLLLVCIWLAKGNSWVLENQEHKKIGDVNKAIAEALKVKEAVTMSHRSNSNGIMKNYYLLSPDYIKF